MHNLFSCLTETETELSMTDRIELGRAYSDPADPDRCFTTSNLRLYAEEADRRSGQLSQTGRGALALALALANRQGSSCEPAGETTSLLCFQRLFDFKVW
jgi:hypothetical protein